VHKEINFVSLPQTNKRCFFKSYTGTGSTSFNKGDKYGTPFEGSYDQLVSNPIIAHSSLTANIQSYNQNPAKQTYEQRPSTGTQVVME